MMKELPRKQNEKAVEIEKTFIEFWQALSPEQQKKKYLYNWFLSIQNQMRKLKLSQEGEK